MLVELVADLAEDAGQGEVVEGGVVADVVAVEDVEVEVEEAVGLGGVVAWL